MVAGLFVSGHIRGNFITPDMRIDMLKLWPLARMVHMVYMSVAYIFEVISEGLGGERLSKGLQGLPRSLW